MLIREMSDLHLEFSNPLQVPEMPEDSETVLILAGDIGVGSKACYWIEQLAPRFKAVIYIMGNHEYYHNDIVHTLRVCQECLKHVPNVHVLNDATVDIEGVRFICSTMWTDFDRENPLTMMQANHGMNDYSIIKRNGDKLTPDHILVRHKKSRAFIEEQLKAKGDMPTVVVTHHGPSFQCVHPVYQREKLNGAYFSDLDMLIEEHGPALWFFGHSHRTTRTQIGQTLVMNNPYGYHGHEVNPDFDPMFRVEITVEE